MKKISVLIPCFNEVENIEAISQAIVSIFENELAQYDYEILFIDNASTDGTRDKIENICLKNKKIKAIYNIVNFGQFNSPFYGICQTTGDCTIAMSCDFQDPPEVIPMFVKEWEQGHKIVCGIKKTSRELGILYFLRTIYYKMIKNMSSVQIIEHFTGFGLYDKTFIELLKRLNDPTPFLRGIVAEYGAGFNLKKVEYEQPKRRAGKTHNNFYSLYDATMLSVTSYTKVGLRVATLLGIACSVISIIVAIFYTIMKFLNWEEFSVGTAPLIIGIFIIGGIQLLFIGLIGEYIFSINTRVIHRPIVVEEKRINF